MPKKKPNMASRFGVGCLLLFALPFAGVGAFMGYRFISSILLWRDAAAWVQTDATLHSLELERHTGDDSTTYKVVAEYDYQYDGQSYSGERVGLFGGADNISNYHHKLHARLKQRFNKKQPVACYVDPNDPSQALLDRQMRLGMLVFHVPFVLGFGGFGFGALAYALAGLGRRRGDRDRAKLYPDQPWRWRRDWQEGQLRQSGGKATAAWVAAALFWNLVCGATLAVALAMESPGSTIFLVVVGLNLAGLALLLQAARVLWRRWRFGVSEFRMASVPGVIGGHLAGVVTVPARVPTDDGFTCTLLCQEQRTHSRDGETTTTYETLWEDQRQIARTLDSGDPGKTSVPVMFTIPSTAKATDAEADCPVSWKLKVEAVTPGPDFETQFEVPVFLTEDSRDGVTVDHAPLSEYEAEPPLAALTAREGIRLEADSPHELRIACPPFRNPATALIITLFTTIWCGIIVFLFREGYWIVGGVMSLFATVGLYATGETLLASSRLSILDDDWTSVAGWLGLRRTRRFRSDDIKRVSSDTVMTSSSSGGESKRWVRLVAHLTNGKKATLVTYLSNRNVERKLLEELRSRARASGGESRDAKQAAPESDDRWQDVLNLPAEEG